MLIRTNILIYILELMFENSGQNSWRIVYPTFHRNIEELLDEISHLVNVYAKGILLKPFIEKPYNHQDEMLINLTLMNQINKNFKQFLASTSFPKILITITHIKYSLKVFFGVDILKLLIHLMNVT